MFRKLVSGLSFSPNLVGELGVYAKYLRREARLRQVGVIVLICAFIVQGVILLYPPESANQANPNDIVYGGVNNRDDLLRHYDTNNQNTQDIMTALGISRGELTQVNEAAYTPQASAYVASRISQADYTSGGRAFPYKKTHGGSGTLYFTPIALYDKTAQHTTAYPALIGTSASGGKFAVIKASGNIAVARLPATLSGTSCPFTTTLGDRDAACLPCPTDSTNWIKSSSCSAPVTYTTTATNNSRNQPAASVTAQPSDRITYTIKAQNIGAHTATAPLVDHIEDILEYADVLETNGGLVDLEAKTISWPEMTLESNQSVERHFSIRLKTHLAADAKGSSNPNSFDCIISNGVGSDIAIPVVCPPAKTVETIAGALPTTNSTLGLTASGLTVLIAIYLYLRARQRQEELRLIRKDLNSGVLS